MDDKSQLPPTPGLIALFGSGETSPTGHKIFDYILQKIPPSPRIVLLETPAGFEVNSAQVIRRVADFIHQHLANYNPIIDIIPARARGTPFSPDDPEILEPLWQADLIFLGPGSPTYAVRQLRDSLAWQMILARHRLGATLALASAATIAISSYALPVYEIYKVGEDLHWKPGLNLFGSFGLPLVLIPHWNNHDGGAELDTSRCFMGQVRFTHLMEMLPVDQIVVGMDEKTGLIIDQNGVTCHIIGQGGVSVLRTGYEHRYHTGQSFPLSEGGPYIKPAGDDGLPLAVWQQAIAMASNKSLVQKNNNISPSTAILSPPSEILELVKQRQVARANKDWTTADIIRAQILTLGWKVEDTNEGPILLDRG